MSTRQQPAPEFTGRHMLLIMLVFFGTIIAVNVGMARLAGSSWSGLVVENSYVASQQFNARLRQSREQMALGWNGILRIAGGAIRYRLLDRDGVPVPAQHVTVRFRHPTYEAADWSVGLATAADGGFEVSHVMRDGRWIVEIDSAVGHAEPYRDVRRITIRNGEFQ